MVIFGMKIQGTVTATLLAVLFAARENVLREVGKDALGRLVVYGSDQVILLYRKQWFRYTIVCSGNEILEHCST